MRCLTTERAWGTSRAGRTLAEMLVVLALLGLVGTAVAPALRDAREPRGAVRTAGDLRDRLQRARDLAAERSATVTVVLDPVSGRTWTLLGDEGTAIADAAPLARPAAGGAVAIAAADSRVRWTFHPAGPAFGADVIVRDARGAIAVGVDRWTGGPHAVAR